MWNVFEKWWTIGACEFMIKNKYAFMNHDGLSTMYVEGAVVRTSNGGGGGGGVGKKWGFLFGGHAFTNQTHNKKQKSNACEMQLMQIWDFFCELCFQIR